MLVAIFYTMGIQLIGRIFFFHVVKTNMFKWVLPGKFMQKFLENLL